MEEISQGLAPFPFIGYFKKVFVEDAAGIETAALCRMTVRILFFQIFEVFLYPTGIFFCRLFILRPEAVVRTVLFEPYHFHVDVFPLGGKI